MNFKHNFFTPLLIFILTSCLICFTFLLIAKKVTDKEYILEISKNVDIIKLIREDDSLNNLLENKKIPKEVLNNLDKEKEREIYTKIIDSLYTNNSSIIKETDISMFIKDSIIKYEDIYELDIYSNIETDINNFSLEFSNKINDDQLIDSIRNIYNYTNGIAIYIIILITMLSIIGIVFLEKKESLLVLGIIFFLFSIVISYIKESLLKELLEKEFVIKYISNQSISKIGEFFKPIYLIIFVIGIILLSVYLIIVIKKILLKIRLMKYDRYYRR